VIGLYFQALKKIVSIYIQHILLPIYGLPVNKFQAMLFFRPPGAIMITVMSEANKRRFSMSMEKFIEMIAVGRSGEPEDIANVCGWIVLLHP